MYTSASGSTWRRLSRLVARSSGLWLTVSTAAMLTPRRRHSWRKNRKYSSPFGEISLSTATRLCPLRFSHADDERGVAAAVAVAEPEAVVALQPFGTAPADERDLQLVRERPDRDRVVGAVRAGDTDAALVDEVAKAVGRVLRRALRQPVLGMQHELDGPVEQPLLGGFVEREAVDLVVAAAGPVEGRAEPSDLDRFHANSRERTRLVYCTTMREVDGKIAVVTGGASGIGLAMGRHFAEHGMQVMLADIHEERLDEAVDALRDDGLSVAGCVTDVTKLVSVERLGVETQRVYGAVHVVCNNAGIGPGGQTSLWEYEEVDWRWAFDVNVLGIAWGIKAFVPIMLAQGTEGHIVNTSSGNGGIAPMGDAAIYATTKSAVTTLTELLYYQLRTQDTQLSCSVLFPGPNWLRTHLWEAWKTRPAEYAKSVARTAAYPTFEEFAAQMEAAGTPLPITPLDEVAARVLDAIRTDTFWINPGNDEPMDARYTSMKERRNPDYFRNWNPTTKT